MEFSVDKKYGGRHILKQILATVASCFISLCSGIAIGITAVMLPQLKQDDQLKYDAAYDSWIASIMTLSMIIGSLCVGTILDCYGRRAAHIILGIPSIIGWVFIGIADSITLILIGRFIIGLTAGANKTVTMVYIGEVSSPRIRMIALFFPSVMTHLGIICGHLIVHYVHWKTSAFIFIFPAAIACISFLFLKESPMWLMAKGRVKEGIESFRWFRGTDEDSEKELALLCDRQSQKSKMNVKEVLRAMSNWSFVKPMMVMMLMMFQTQFTGVNVLSFYSQDIFEKTFSKNVDSFILIIAADFVGTVMSFVACLLSKFSRKFLFLGGSLGVSLCLFGLIVSLVWDIKELEWIPVTCMIVYVCFSSIIVTISWTFAPELFPNSLRGLGTGINSAFSYICLFVVVKITPDIMNVFGQIAMYGLYAITTFVFGIMAFFLLPETNGKTLQSIEDNYNNNNTKQVISKT